ncbi:hypothetical protein MLD38_034576 [Melastoma candidum]|uniref:Uncharacterized protein n=1 Tax=Melastoma candidum TaxID=119954 RepID=A0ACB9MAW7_9MYRT|nr:hypothetical protein MLD38_034576 [Melastoma candidum]
MDHAGNAARTDLMTIARYVLNEQSKHPESRRDFTILLNRIVLGCKFVCSSVNKGEEQKKLDVLSNEVFMKALVSSGRTCILVSEEDEEATFVEPSKRGRYCIVFDPLDGSSNIDCGVSIGTIFGIYLMKDGQEPTLEDVLQPGKHMVAAGYCMYGTSCTLVLSTGSGVNGFTLDPSLGEFIVTHPLIKHGGGLHRTLLYGGIFLYPGAKKSPNGKLRVLYEVFPMSFLMEQAGGQAFTGKGRRVHVERS